MNPMIFPGLSEPKSKLYFDIQAMIGKEGGRLTLARRIESEQTKVRRFRIKKEAVSPKTDRRLYSKYEDEVVLSDLTKIEKLTKIARTWPSMQQRLTKILGPVKNRAINTAILERKKENPKNN